MNELRRALGEGVVAVIVAILVAFLFLGLMYLTQAPKTHQWGATPMPIITSPLATPICNCTPTP